MKLLFDPVRKQAAEAIFQQTQSLAPEITLAQIYAMLVEPPNPELGDLAFGCFILAKSLKKAPPALAQDLAAKLSAPEFQVQASGPYLNFKFTMDFLNRQVLVPILQNKTFSSKLTSDNPKTMVEFSQPNTHKELHVGHMRNLSLGDALVRMLRYSGHELITSTFPGDVGTHVAKCLWYLKYHNKEAVPATHKGEWLGRIYSKAHLKLEDELNTPQEAINREQLTEILKQLEAKSGPYFETWKETRQWSIELMGEIYKWANVSFDQWYWESDVDSDSVKWIKELYAQGKLIESQNAIGMDLSAFDLGFCLLLKSDGTGLYATKDLELARRKFQDFHIQKSIYVVDMRQALHFKQVFKSLELLGFKEAHDCFHLQYNFVELPDGAMSSRKGNIIPITDLIGKMETLIQEKYLSRYQDEWSATEIRETAEIVAKGAIKYGMLKMDTNKKIVFDMEEWLKLDGESGPFIQYSYARINSLKRKLDFNVNNPIDGNALKHFAERQLMQHLIHFNNLVVNSAESYKPASLCAYLYDLAKKFNLFYHDCPIANAPDETTSSARLALAAATGEVLKKGLDLLGIPVPERM